MHSDDKYEPYEICTPWDCAGLAIFMAIVGLLILFIVLR